MYGYVGDISGLLDYDAEMETEATQKQLESLIAAMARDWARLNAFLNATASAYDWCGTYEDRLDRYNSLFEILQLENRSEEERRCHHKEDPYSPWTSPHAPCHGSSESLVQVLNRIAKEGGRK